jgi:hypothetical protein
MYVFKDVCVWGCIYEGKYVGTYVHMYVCICVGMFVFVWGCKYLCVDIFMFVGIYVCVGMNLCVCGVYDSDFIYTDTYGRKETGSVTGNQ